MKKSVTDLEAILNSIGTYDEIFSHGAASKKSTSSISELKKQLFPFLFQSEKTSESIPEIQLTYEENRKSEHDLCIAAASSASPIANSIQECLKGSKVTTLECPDNSHVNTFNAAKAEGTIAR